MRPRLHFAWALLATVLIAGCGQPSLADRLHGGWVIETVNGKPVPESARNRVAVAFHNDGTLQRGDESGTFEVLNDATIRTHIGDRVELVVVEVSGETLTMRTAGMVVTELGRRLKD